MFNIKKKLEYKREAVIVFANLQKNKQARDRLKDYTLSIGLIAYTVGLLTCAILTLLWTFLLSFL